MSMAKSVDEDVPSSPCADALVDRTGFYQQAFSEERYRDDSECDDDFSLPERKRKTKERSCSRSYDNDAKNSSQFFMEHALHSLRQKRNKRERLRWRKIRDAFDALRDRVPRGEYEELSQLHTLRRAIDYIRSLQSLLVGDVRGVTRSGGGCSTTLLSANHPETCRIAPRRQGYPPPLFDAPALARTLTTNSDTLDNSYKHRFAGSILESTPLWTRSCATKERSCTENSERTDRVFEHRKRNFLLRSEDRAPYQPTMTYCRPIGTDTPDAQLPHQLLCESEHRLRCSRTECEEENEASLEASSPSETLSISPTRWESYDNDYGSDQSSISPPSLCSVYSVEIVPSPGSRQPFSVGVSHSSAVQNISNFQRCVPNLQSCEGRSLNQMRRSAPGSVSENDVLLARDNELGRTTASEAGKFQRTFPQPSVRSRSVCLTKVPPLTNLAVLPISGRTGPELLLRESLCQASALALPTTSTSEDLSALFDQYFVQLTTSLKKHYRSRERKSWLQLNRAPSCHRDGVFKHPCDRNNSVQVVKDSESRSSSNNCRKEERDGRWKSYPYACASSTSLRPSY